MRGVTGLCVWCRVVPASERCENIQDEISSGICRECHVAKRLAYACPCLTIQQALKEHNEMAAKKSVPKANGDMVERHRYEEKLPCKVEGVDIDAAAQEMARVHRQREAMREQKRETNAKFRERLNFFDERMTELGEIVEHKTERRSVEVVEYLIARTNEIRVVRQDTGEVIETRAAKADELQDGLFEQDAKTDRPPKRRGRPPKGDPTDPETQDEAE